MNTKHLLLSLLSLALLGVHTLSAQEYREDYPEDAGRVVSVCSGTRVPMYVNPGKNSSVLGYVYYTEELLHLGQEALLRDERNNYILVESADGRQGWIDDRQLVRNGGVVVLLQDAGVFNKPSTYSTATGLRFYAGELLILSDWEDDWVYLTGENKRLFGWTEDYEKLSVEAVDVEIAGKMRRALMIEDPNDRKTALKDIGATPGFMGTPMREIVKSTIDRLYFNDTRGNQGVDFLENSGNLGTLNTPADIGLGVPGSTSNNRPAPNAAATTGQDTDYSVEAVIDPVTQQTILQVRERGSIAAVKAKNPPSIYYAYHKTVPVGTSLLLEVPSAPGQYIPLTVVASLKDSNPNMIGLGAEVIQKVFGVATAKEAGKATIYYTQPE